MPFNSIFQLLTLRNVALGRSIDGTSTLHGEDLGGIDRCQQKKGGSGDRVGDLEEREDGRGWG